MAAAVTTAPGCPPHSCSCYIGIMSHCCAQQKGCGAGARLLGAISCLSPSLQLEAFGEVVPMVPSPPWLHSKHGKCPCPGGGEGAAPPPSHAAVSSIQSPQAVPLWVPQPCSLLPLGLRQLQSAATFYRWDFAGVGGRGGAFLELCLHFWSFLRDTFSRQPPPPQQPVGLQLFQNTVPISLPCWAAPRAKSMCWGVSTPLPAVPRCQCQTVRPHISPPAPPPPV